MPEYDGQKSFDTSNEQGNADLLDIDIDISLEDNRNNMTPFGVDLASSISSS